MLGAPFTIVFVDEARSADPPTSSGIFGAIALSTIPDAARLAMFPFSAVNVGISSSHPSSNSREGAFQFMRVVRMQPTCTLVLLLPLSSICDTTVGHLPPVGKCFRRNVERLRAMDSRVLLLSA